MSGKGKVLALLVVIAAGVAGALLLRGGEAPPSAPGAGGAALASVKVPARLSETERAGAALFAANCATCHGGNAAGRGGQGPPLVHKIYEPSHHADGAFFLAATRGVRQHHWTFGDMAPVPEVSEADVAAIVAYVRALQRENGIF
ncbi:c-type cytochrome [Stappia indica]|uniref:c-type cytochrome n=1 Tax=Stappia indica TaxID=538381 RepID=UPI001CD78FC2|nr:cytochrome c [Stappia indica]MCA1297372.1 cytochrome c [Stappia indica]